MPTNTAVHATHCCTLHGCKYGDSDCPVVNGKVEQEYLCEDCGNDGINSFEDLEAVTNGEKMTCPNCGHIVPTQ